MKPIDCSSYSFNVGGQPVKSVTFSAIGFVDFMRLSRDVRAFSRSDEAMARNTFRARLKHQATLQLADGKSAPFTDEIITGMPPRLGIRLKAVLDAGTASLTQPKMIHKGDGVAESVHIQLANPLKSGNGHEIKELEFQAKSFGDMEDVIVADDRVAQMTALLAVARPVDGNLIALPSWAVSQITLIDGLFIMNEVLPCFLDDQAPENQDEPAAAA